MGAGEGMARKVTEMSIVAALIEVKAVKAMTEIEALGAIAAIAVVFGQSKKLWGLVFGLDGSNKGDDTDWVLSDCVASGSGIEYVNGVYGDKIVDGDRVVGVRISGSTISSYSEDG